MDLSFIYKRHFHGVDSANVGCIRYPKDVNGGDCFVWAWIAKKYFPQAKLCSVIGHAFVKIGDKYYDSESPRGVKHWGRLKTNRDLCGDEEIDEFEIFSKRNFREYWNYSWPNLRVYGKIKR